MYKLSELKVAEGSVHKHFRRGQGIGTGNGKQAGRGRKGQRARSGSGKRPDLPVVTSLCSVSSLSVDSTLLTK